MRKKTSGRSSETSGEKHREPLPAAKRRLFSLVVFSLPILVLLVLEISLRQIEYQGNLNLVIRRNVGDKEVYSINRSVARRYFAQAGTSIPEPADDTFEIRKSPNTKRIFCLGESTMAGFPYEFNATAPGFLRDRLKAELPQYNIEVINVGLAAVGSYVVDDFIRELIDYEPDLFIVYLGHNEFYGVYGVGSTVSSAGGHWLKQLTISLLKFKTFLLLRDGYNWVRRQFVKPATRSDASLMEQMVASQVIPWRSQLYQEAMETFRTNLESIIRSARDQKVPVLFANVVSNIKDQPPFQGIFADHTSNDMKDAWKDLINVGDRFLVERAFSAAENAFNSATEIDTMNATAFYKQGLALFRLNQIDKAKRMLRHAKDLDALRFRATEDFKQVLLDVCGSEGAYIARVDSAFEASSPHGIIGKELMLEHLHPNIEGYFLMAKTFAQAIRDNNLLVPAGEWKAPVKSDAEYFEMSAVSDFDRLMGEIKIDLLTHKWPFTDVVENYTFTPTNAIESLVYSYVRGRKAWSDARYELAQYYASIKRYDLARRECLAVSKVIPFSYQPLLRYADYFRMEGRKVEAEAAYLRCIEAEENPFARMQLGVLLLESDRPTEAREQLQAAFSVEESGRYKLPRPAAASGRYLLGVANAQLGQFDEASRQLQRSLAIDPDYEYAKELLRQLPK